MGADSVSTDGNKSGCQKLEVEAWTKLEGKRSAVGGVCQRYDASLEQE